MAGAGVKIVTRSVQIDRQQADRIQAVLLAVGLRWTSSIFLAKP